MDIEESGGEMPPPQVPGLVVSLLGVWESLEVITAQGSDCRWFLKLGLLHSAFCFLWSLTVAQRQDKNF